MIRKKWIDIAAVIAMTFALVFAITLTYFPQVFALEARKSSMQYETQLFDKNGIMTVDILMSDEDWQDMLDHASAEEYYCCDVVVNGVPYHHVGIRPKGNTSLSQIVSDDTTDRFSFKIEFDHYDSTQTCMGLDKLVLNNMMADATCRKEYISYDIMDYLGVSTSLYSYASVSRNGENWGLYFALEGMEEAYAQRMSGSSYGQLYKPESLGMGGRGDFGSGQGSDLAYIDDDVDSYRAIFDSAVFEPTKEDKKRVVEALKNIQEGTNLEACVDVDSMLRYIAANTFLVNDDGYLGNMLHNYYLYEKDGKLTMLPWDYNLAFGGFQSHDADAVINRGIDDVVAGRLEDRPMIASLLAVEEYQQRYYALLEKLINSYFENGHFAELMDNLDELLDEYVAEDPTAFYTYDEYKEANEMLRLFCEKRAESIRKQLDGRLARSVSAQTDDSRVDTAQVMISVMGSQFGGDREPADGRDGFEPGEGEAAPQMPEDMKMPMPEDFAGNFPGDFHGAETAQNITEGILWLGISAAVMLAGLLFARFYPKSRF